MKAKLFLLSVLIVTCMTSAWGQSNYDRHNYDKRGYNPPMTKGYKMGNMMHTKFDIMPILRDPKLKLSDDQLSKIDTIQKKAIIDIEKKQIELQQERLNIKQELFLDSPDLTKIKSIVDKKASIDADLEYLVIKRDLDIKAIMTKEQLNIFQDTMRTFMMEKKFKSK